MMQDDGGKLVEAIARAAAATLSEEHNTRLDEWLIAAVARSALAAIEREGWKVVPVEPTEEMLDAREVPGVLEGSDIRLVWLAMLDASPKRA